MTATEPYACPLCGEPGEPDERRPAEIADLTFASVTCGRSGGVPVTEEDASRAMPGHLFPLRWLETEVATADDVDAFNKRFTWVRAPFEPGSAIEEAFGDTDPILAWIEQIDTPDRIRLLIRL